MTTIKIWIKKRTGKLVPVVIRPEEQLKAVLPLAKVKRLAIPPAFIVFL